MAVRMSAVSTVFNQLLSQEEASRGQEVVEFKYLPIRGVPVFTEHVLHCAHRCKCVCAQDMRWEKKKGGVIMRKTSLLSLKFSYMLYYCIKVVLLLHKNWIRLQKRTVLSNRKDLSWNWLQHATVITKPSLRMTMY